MIQRGNGTELKGNILEYKGNTAEKWRSIRFHEAISSLFFSHKGNTKRATPAWGLFQ
jgi:hypothetical protein